MELPVQIEEEIASSIADRYGLLIDPATLRPIILQLQQTHSIGEGALLRDWLLQPSRLRDLVGQLTIGESYFFRHPEQLHAISTWVAQRRAEGRPVTIWSAGCSRGEELYSVAMRLLLDQGPSVRQEVFLYGTDIDVTAVEAAQRGLYNRWSLRGTTEAERSRFFHVHDGCIQLVEALRSWPQFDNLSIQERLTQWPEGKLDVVFFRNVGIYFTPSGLLQVHREFVRVLGTDGLLVQSATDPRPSVGLFSGTTTMPVGLFAPVQSTQHVSRQAGSTPGDSRGIPRTTERRGDYRRESSVRLTARRATTRVSALQASPSNRPVLDSAIEGISSLADRGHLDEAERRVTAHLALHPRSTEGLLLRGQLALHREEPNLAVQALRSLLFLEPEHHLGRYWYVMALEHAGQPHAASEQLRELQRVLISSNDSAMPLSIELQEAIRELVRGR